MLALALAMDVGAPSYAHWVFSCTCFRYACFLFLKLEFFFSRCDAIIRLNTSPYFCCTHTISKVALTQVSFVDANSKKLSYSCCLHGGLSISACSVLHLPPTRSCGKSTSRGRYS